MWTGKNIDVSNPQFTQKIVLIGPSCGKTEIFKAINGKGKRFKTSYSATIGADSENKIIRIKQSQVTVQIWDTAGQERFQNSMNALCRGAHIILLCFSLDMENLHTVINPYIKDIQNNARDAKIILVGTKLDRYEHIPETFNQTVSQLKQEKIIHAFHAVSAKEKTNLDILEEEIKDLIASELPQEEKVLSHDSEPLKEAPQEIPLEKEIQPHETVPAKKSLEKDNKNYAMRLPLNDETDILGKREILEAQPNKIPVISELVRYEPLPINNKPSVQHLQFFSTENIEKKKEMHPIIKQEEMFATAKIILLGPKNSGKTELYKAIHGKDECVNASFTRNIGKTSCALQFFDTSGHEQSLAINSCKNANFILLCFPLNTEELDIKVEGYVKNIKNIEPNAKIILVGTMFELSSNAYLKNFLQIAKQFREKEVVYDSQVTSAQRKYSINELVSQIEDAFLFKKIFHYAITLIGPTSGKTELFNAMNGESELFEKKSYQPTRGSNLKCKKGVYGQSWFWLNLWDTPAGLENAPDQLTVYCKSSQLILLCFPLDMKNLDMFAVAAYTHFIKKHAPHVRIILVGTKLDRSDNHQLEIFNQIAERLKKDESIHDYQTVSVKEGTNLENLEDKIKDQIRLELPQKEKSLPLKIETQEKEEEVHKGKEEISEEFAPVSSHDALPLQRFKNPPIGELESSMVPNTNIEHQRHNEQFNYASIPMNLTFFPSLYGGKIIPYEDLEFPESLRNKKQMIKIPDPEFVSKFIRNKKKTAKISDLEFLSGFLRNKNQANKIYDFGFVNDGYQDIIKGHFMSLREYIRNPDLKIKKDLVLLFINTTHSLICSLKYSSGDVNILTVPLVRDNKIKLRLEELYSGWKGLDKQEQRIAFVSHTFELVVDTIEEYCKLDELKKATLVPPLRELIDNFRKCIRDVGKEPLQQHSEENIIYSIL